MSREIKFRAWDKSSEYMHSNVQSGVYEDPDEWTEFSTVLGLECFEVMQYTGLKDKNSKEIFNGDIVERKGIKYQITLEIGSFLLVKIDENTDMYEEFVDCWNDHVYPLSQLYWNNSDEENHIYDLEVIGNIYENPELLEATA
ncbi:hypothetical protein J1907_17910 [Lysinibacillus sphaericus]|uniref:YopX family protein n=1 Tax=Lysinibacillus sphaericus TaxID=1421 RepID=UPI0006913298|nr:YopX family protein [Lysinibacillus sphaericus]QTB21602.1 hypothetical protein J1907_17910 [Lysinibacillus sphaericus]